MTLIVKPTLKCQFRCEFCSAAKFDFRSSDCMEDDMWSAMVEASPDDVIVSGGDPLMMDPSFFEKLVTLRGGRVHVSATTNLWALRKDSDKWSELLHNPRFGLVTSFQYGDKRRKPNGEPYTENDFLESYRIFKDVSGGRNLDFIAVIGEDNASRALDHVRLAKSLGCQCKLNAVLPLGRSTEYFPRYKLLDIYLKVLESGLGDYETNIANRGRGMCPFSQLGCGTGCFSCNRAIVRGADGKLKFGHCEELMAMGVEDYGSLSEVPPHEPLRPDELIEGPKCLECPLCGFCNGCKVHRLIAKRDPSYCQEMAKYAVRAESYGFLNRHG